MFSSCFAASDELSKQAVAFYNDNNYVKTMDLILQINEKERSAQDWLILGNIYADKGRLEDAIYMYKKAVERDKKCYKAYYNLGNYYTERGQFDLALDSYTKASKVKDDNPYIFYNLGCIYLKKDMLNKARANFNKAIMYDSKIPEFHYNLAYVYKKLNNDKMAKTYLDNYNKLISE
jgi:tetratricopeptide (TPR) repeat protein